MRRCILNIVINNTRKFFTVACTRYFALLYELVLTLYPLNKFIKQFTFIVLAVFNLSSCSKLVSVSYTKGESYAFPGIANLSVLPSGSFSLSWPAVPDGGTVYSIYSRRSNLGESYNFSADPIIVSSETLVRTDAFPLNETRCFLVRAKSNEYTTDTNTKELCSSDDGLSDFSGIYDATSVISGQVTVSWAKSVNPNVAGYNVYQGANFRVVAAVAQSSTNSFVVMGLSPGQSLQFGVRAYDKNGREDNNTITKSVTVSSATVAAGDFLGCVSASALDTSNVLLTVAFPPNASSMTVLRDGVAITSLVAGVSTQYLDSGLAEGKTYRYTCHAMVNGVTYLGTRSIDAATLNVNPPSFSGIASLTAVGARSLRVGWGASSGVSAFSYKVWVQLGAVSSTNFDFTQTPTVTVSSGVLETIITGLGDELTYTVAIRACSAAGICDTNRVVLSKTLSDGGAPTSLGATAALMANGTAQITAPWDSSKGAVAYRRIYIRSGTVGGTNINDYTLLREELVSDQTNPATTLTVTQTASGAALAENTTYHFIVRDKDPSGNVSENTSSVSVATGDLTAPLFSGITSLNNGASGADDTTLVAQFTAVAAESVVSSGPSYYLVYKTSDGSDPCSSSVSALAQIAASAYTLGDTVSYTVTGLSPRTNYKVCVKARDSSSNISTTTSSLAKTTRDITPPTFNGVQTISYSTTTSALSLTWNAATSATGDVGSYVITLWKNSVTPANTTTLTKSVSFSGIASGISITTGFVMSSLDTVYAVVNACDNAATGSYAAADNCTTLTTAKSVTLPDIVAPVGFTGITSVAPVAGTSNLLVSWNAPSDWSDYRGFKIYSVATNGTTDSDLTLVKDCYCSASGANELTACSTNPLTSCTVTGLDARRTYNYYVRAYDAAGNLTSVLSPWTGRKYAQTLDVSAPTFASGLNVSWQSSPAGILVNYSAATDNQYSSESGAAITYKIYRKSGSTFAAASNPAADGTLIPAASSLSYLDPAANLAEGFTYYYGVCAVDASNNTQCDGQVRSQAVIDFTPPTFAGGITSLVAGSPSDTRLVASWGAIAPECTGTNIPVGCSLNGPTTYTIYISDSSTNPCTAGALVGTEPAAPYASGSTASYTITGLTQRTAYRVCVKARDAALNQSSTTAYLAANTTDITPPTFAGAQSALYSTTNSRIDITWSAATTPDMSASDLSTYLVSVWNATTPGSVTLLTKTASLNATGTTITPSDFAFTSNSTVMVVVNACDSYTPVPNCSQIAASSALAVNIPDTSPPAGFAGITSVAALSPRSGSNGAVTVTWFAPSIWVDYSGFNIYAVSGDTTTCSYGQASDGACLTFLKACACVQSDCSDHLTSCTVSNLSPGRSYYFYARAYDSVGNQSYIQTPNLLSGKKLFRVSDLVAPTFSSALSSSWDSTNKKVTLSWNAASDNQYYDASDSLNNMNNLGYKVYRKAGSTFASATNPSADGQLLTNSPDTLRTYQDLKSLGLTEGTTYYYTVCTYDRASLESGTPSDNTTCDGTVRSNTIPDETAPVISTFAANPSLPNRSNQPFSVSWNLTDNVSSANNISVIVYRTITNSPSTATESAGVYTSGAGLTSVSAQTGTIDADKYFNYLIVATDPSGNSSSAAYSILSDRTNPNLTITSPASGSTTRALHYEVVGTCEFGASLSATVSGSGAQVASSACDSGGVLSVKVLLPEGGNSHTLTVTNTDTSGNAVTLTRSFVSFACPTGYVGVPGKWSDDADVNGLGLNGDGTNSDATGYARAGRTNAGYDPTRDFCVMKYLAKVATSNNGGQQAWEKVYDGNKDFITGTAPTIASNYWPESRADSTPWVNITRDEAIDRCNALNEAFGHCSGTGCYASFSNNTWGFRLMSNTEWQVIARNLEATGANWTSGTVGTGYLWRGHSDNATNTNSDLHGQSFYAYPATTPTPIPQLVLSNPKADSGSTDYFGTGNSASENSSGTTGWTQRRRFVLSTGNAIWDMAGNVFHILSDSRSDLGIPSVDETGILDTNVAYSYLNSGANRFSATTNLIFGSLGNNGTQFSEILNAGMLTGGSGNAIRRGGPWGTSGLFAANLSISSTTITPGLGFRCAYVPPTYSGSSDTIAPTVSSVSRLDSAGVATTNPPITVGEGGFWNLGWTVADAENTGTTANQIFVQIRRKVSSTSTDIPVLSDAIYKSGYKLTSLLNETAWVQDSSTGQYTRNDSTYVNYLITAIDPSGNMASRTFSVQNSQSCPPGYVGVPGNMTAGLGNASATVGNSNASLDPSRDFCIMKYEAKPMSAGTTLAQSSVGGLFEPIWNGANASFATANAYDYTDPATFNTKIKYLPESRFSGAPWTYISRDNAVNLCRTQQMQYLGSMPDTSASAGYQLVSNTQWQVAARDIATTGANWSGNTIGTGVLNRGHTDNAIGTEAATNSWNLAVSAGRNDLMCSSFDANYYFATGNTSAAAWNTLGTSPATGTEQKRTHSLSNGAVLWDMAGNLLEYVSDNRSSLGLSTTDEALIPATSPFRAEFITSGANTFSAATNLIFGDLGMSGLQYLNTKGQGSVYGPTSGWDGIARGGYFQQGAFAGLFETSLLNPSSLWFVSFRCAYNPPPPSGSVSGYAPQISALRLVNDMGDAVGNNAITIAGGGSWNLKWRITDTESAAANIAVTIYRKVTSTVSDFPTTSDSPYRTGTAASLVSLLDETAWESTSVNNNNTYVNYLITATDAAGNVATRTFSVQNTASCPSGYVGVPGNSTAGLGSVLATIGNATASLDPSRDFCVMKYPAKDNNSSTYATSTATGTPWVNITRDNAAAACSANGTGFGLISNTRWQVVARNAENVASNWSGGAVGSGVLNRGHSDGTPGGALANSTDDTDGYFGTLNTGFTSAAWSALGATPAAGSEQKRTYNLSNGSVVWDVGGNIWQWMSDNYSSLGVSPAIAASWDEFSNTTNFPLGGVNRLLFAPSGSYTSAQNAGQQYGASSGTARRGGSWNFTLAAGLFTAGLNNSTSAANDTSGFRCTYTP